MFTFTVDMPNGFTVNLDEEKQRNSGAQLVEMDQDKVNVYYDNVSPWFGFLHSFLTLYWLFSILCILNCVEASTSEVEVSRRILGCTPLYSCDSFYLYHSCAFHCCWRLISDHSSWNRTTSVAQNWRWFGTPRWATANRSRSLHSIITILVRSILTVFNHFLHWLQVPKTV